MKRFLLKKIFRLTLVFFCIWPACLVWGQNIPADLEVIGVAGGMEPGRAYATVSITANGQGNYSRFASGNLMTPALESNAFTLTSTQVGQLWRVVQDYNFFGLDSEYTNNNVIDGCFADLIITANGNTHIVSTKNIAVAAFDTVTSTINALTPGDDDLVYNKTLPFTFISQDICERLGKIGQITVPKRITKNTGNLAEKVIPPAASFASEGNAHSGSVVGYRMTLRDAINRGIVTLTGKGGYFGDCVSISADNSSNATNNRLNISLYLEFWGPEASEAKARIIEDAIENIWNGKTTADGKNVTIDVITRTDAGGTLPPGTENYHQIKLENTETSFVDRLFAVNEEGVTSGIWSTAGDLLDKMYSHEAGHLLGLPDQYEDYKKSSSGIWIRKSDGQTLSTDALADIVAPKYSGTSKDQIKQLLGDPTRRRITIPVDGHENDLMAALEGEVHQSHIDAIATQAGAIVEVRQGDILVNKDENEQNFVITRSEDVFVSAGGNKTINGLFAACIDHYKGIPSNGVGFDLGPSLSAWRGIEAAQYLEMLVDYVNKNDLFCSSNYSSTQHSIWRIADNSNIGDSEVDTFLEEAGIHLEDQILDFPRMTNPNADNPNTSSLTPPELFVPDITASPGNLLNVGTTVSLTGSVDAPSLEGISTSLSWLLSVPAGSTSTLSSNQGETTLFTPDARGVYRARLNVDVTDTLANTFNLETFASFTAADNRTETFERGSLESGSPFFWKTKAENPWIISNGASNSGSFSALSASIDDDGITTLEASFEQTTDGFFSFAYKISSEDGYDILSFSIDGQVKGEWSGEIDWSTFSINLAAGKHTAVWSYEKDGSASEGIDRVWIDDVFFPESMIITAVEESAKDVLPKSYQLLQNYPNPFNAVTTITYTIPQTQHVRLTIYDALGRQVAILVNGLRSSGEYRVQFDAQVLSSGIYYYELHAGLFREQKAMVVIK